MFNRNLLSIIKYNDGLVILFSSSFSSSSFSFLLLLVFYDTQWKSVKHFNEHIKYIFVYLFVCVCHMNEKMKSTKLYRYFFFMFSIIACDDSMCIYCVRLLPGIFNLNNIKLLKNITPFPLSHLSCAFYIHIRITIFILWNGGKFSLSFCSNQMTLITVMIFYVVLAMLYVVGGSCCCCFFRWYCQRYSFLHNVI